MPYLNRKSKQGLSRPLNAMSENTHLTEVNTVPFSNETL